MGKHSPNKKNNDVQFSYGNFYQPDSAQDAYSDLLKRAQEVALEVTGVELKVWDHVRHVEYLKDCWDYEPYFRKYWLNNLVKWVGYNLWNHVYKLDGTKKAEQNSDRAHGEYAKLFL